MKTKTMAVLLAITATFGGRARGQIYDTNINLVETLAGSSAIGLVNGLGAQAEFSAPNQIVSDSYGNLFVLDSANKLIRKITPSGAVSTFVGGGTAYQGYGTNVSLISGGGSMTIDSSNTIWLTASLAGLTYLSTISNLGFASIQNVNLPGLSQEKQSICADSSNNIYYWFYSTSAVTNYIYRYSPTSYVSLPFATIPYPGINPVLSVDSSNNLYLWSKLDGLIRKVNQNGVVTVIAGHTAQTNADGFGVNASLTNVLSMVGDNAGNIIATCGNCIRKITPSGSVVTIAGSFTQSGYADGVGSNSLFSAASGSSYSQGAIFVADSNNERIRKILINPVPISGTGVSLNTYPGLTITGMVNRAYQVQSSPDLNTWNVVAPIILLNSSPYLWFDPNPVSGNKFYRALLLP